MKQIKKIVLKSATDLTNSEMKKLRGGYDPGNDHSAACTAQCPAEFGGSSVELNCSGLGGYCDIYSGVYPNGIPYYGVACFAEEGILTDREDINLCKLTELLK